MKIRYYQDEAFVIGESGAVRLTTVPRVWLRFGSAENTQLYTRLGPAQYTSSGPAYLSCHVVCVSVHKP